APIAERHHRPVNLVQVGQTVKVACIGEFGVDVGKRPGPAGRQCNSDVRYQMDDTRLALAVPRYQVPVDRVEHHGPWAEVKRHIVAENAADGNGYRPV